MAFEDQQTLHLVPGAKAEGLPLGPADVRVLEAVDGRKRPRDLADATGFQLDQVRESIEMLEWLGVVRYADRLPSLPPARRRSTRAPAPADEKVDLPDERRRKVDSLFAKLDTLNHYELLEVEPTASKKGIKDAYFSKIPVFHPDKYFGKELGSYKKKLETIFRRLTEAHDILTRKKSRAEYDEYLGLGKQTARETKPPADPRAADALLRAYLESQAPPVAYRGEAEPAAAQSPAKEEPAEPDPPPAESPPPSTAQPSTAEPDPASEPEEPARRPSVDEEPASSSGRHVVSNWEKRRRALARKHVARVAKPSAPDVTPPPSNPESRAKVAEDLKRLYSNRGVAVEHRRQIERYVEQAEAVLDDDPVSGANLLRIALSLAPNDTDLKRRYEEADQKAARTLAETYVRRGNYEAEHGDWQRAMQSYQRAAIGRPEDAKALERAAYAILKADGEIRDAVKFAKQAVLADPHYVDARSTAALAYQSAGMTKSALGELTRAVELDPKNSALKKWHKRLKAAGKS